MFTKVVYGFINSCVIALMHLYMLFLFYGIRFIKINVKTVETNLHKYFNIWLCAIRNVKIHFYGAITRWRFGNVLDVYKNNSCINVHIPSELEWQYLTPKRIYLKWIDITIYYTCMLRDQSDKTQTWNHIEEYRSWCRDIPPL